MSHKPRTWISRCVASNLVWNIPTITRAMPIALGLAVWSSLPSWAVKDEQAVKGLSFKPRQANVVFDQVSDKDLERCTSVRDSKNKIDALSILGPEGQMLRRFADVNGDGKVDQWCYYKDGIEVYRDIDSNFNQIADQYRWLGTGGARWGTDANEDGKIDAWKSLSSEEATMELVEAIKNRDEDRFRRLLVTEKEIQSMGLGEEKAKQLLERVELASREFTDFARTQKQIDSSSKWAHFAADKPGVVAAGTDGSTKDVTAYENVIAIIDNEGTSQQVMVGTVVQIDQSWKLIDLPRLVSDGTSLADTGFFFPAATNSNRGMVSNSGGGLSTEMQGLLTELERIDSKIKSTGAADEKLAALHEERAEVLTKLVTITKGTNEMELWVRQFVDSVSSAAMQGEFPKGLGTLRSFESQLPILPGGKSLMPYVAYRTLTTEYQVKSQEEGVNFSKLQANHMENLETYANAYADSPDAADAMIQIALNYELSGEEKSAINWYRKVVEKFPTSGEGKKSKGAIARLSLEGRQFSLSGKTLDGKATDTKQFRTPVIIQYWASWCEPCKNDMSRLKSELAKKPRSFQVVGVNLDNDPKAAEATLKTGIAPWPHIHEGNGFESDLATGLGVLSVPVTILIDDAGKVVKRTSGFTQDMEKALDDLIGNSTPPTKTSSANTSGSNAPKIQPVKQSGSSNNPPPVSQKPSRPGSGSTNSSGNQGKSGSGRPGK